MNDNDWLKERVVYLNGIKGKSDQQELLVLLAENPNRTTEDEKILKDLIAIEKLRIKLAKSSAVVANKLNAKKKAEAQAERKARTHELCNSAGLLILAGLVDAKTGKPTIDKAELLGALLGLAKVPKEDQRRSEWKRAGAALLAEQKID